MSKISGILLFAARSFILKGILLSVALLLFIASPAASQTACVAPPADMTAWFTLDETTGTSSDDLAGIPNTGTHINGPVPVLGVVDGALSFDGVDDYVEAADHPELNFGTGDFSIDAWIKTDDVSGVRPIVEKRSASPVQGYSFFLYGGELYLQLADASGPSDSCSRASTSSCTNYGTSVFVADGTWHHIAVTVTRNDATGIRYYVDGVLVATDNPTERQGSLTNSGPLRIGNRTIDGNSVIHGTIDELELFNRALSPAEISSIWAAGSDGKCKTACVTPPANMTAWFTLDETTGTSSADLAGAANTGTHINGPVPVPGVVDGALSFDGVDDYVEAADHPELNFGTGDFSIDAWIKADNVSGIRPIGEKRSAYPTHGYSFYLVNGNLYLQMADASGPSDFCSTDPYSSCTNYGTSVFVADGTWHHVAVTVTRNDASGIRFYVDGALAATDNPASRQGSITNSGPLRIGNRTISVNSVFQGTIDELELFNRALSQAEISSIWAGGSDGKCKTAVVDTTPDPFSFASQTGVALNTAITSNTITVSGINAPAAISVSGGAYSVNGGAYTSAAGTVNNGDTVNVRLTSSSTLSTTTIATLTIGGISGTFSVTTAGSYTITATAGANGSISPSGSVSVASGGLQSFKVTPDFGYHIANVIVDGVSIGAISRYDFINVVANHTIHAEFTLDTFSITASIIIGNGTITPAGVTMVSRGGSQAYTINAGPGYYIAWVVVDGVDKGALTSYTFSNVTADHTIRVYLKLIAYTITSSAGTGGSISPSGSVSVAGGSDQSFAITPNAGYFIADVLIDGVPAGAVASYTFTNVTAAHTISASFAANPVYTISASAGANGSISPSGNTTVTRGTKLTCIITPDAGYRVANVIVDGVSIGPAAVYNFTNITASHTISASFILDEYSITASTIGSGTITPAGVTMVSKGGSLVYTITPGPGYYVSSVIVDGSSKGALSTYTFTNVKANHTIKAYFKK